MRHSQPAEGLTGNALTTSARSVRTMPRYDRALKPTNASPTTTREMRATGRNSAAGAKDEPRSKPSEGKMVSDSVGGGRSGR